MDLVQNSFAQLELSYPNMLHNYNYFRSKLKDTTKLLILIKANSYGHGALEFARQMEKAGADYFGIAHPVEGVELREGGIKTPIIVLTAGTDSFEDIVNHYLEPSIPSMEALLKFDAYLKSRDIEHYPVHIKLDTGMHRLGFMKQELPELIEYLKNKPRVKVQSIFSHLAASDDPQHDEFTHGQYNM
jgi:alanine racemase